MLPHALSALLAAVHLLSPGRAPAARDARRAIESDTAAEAAIAAELRAFYRDLDRGSWTALLDHFLPAKVTARWAPPAASRSWANLETPTPAPGDGARAAEACAPRFTVAVVGEWARARVRRCGDRLDEAWLLRVSGHWRIVHLALARPPAV